MKKLSKTKTKNKSGLLVGIIILTFVIFFGIIAMTMASSSRDFSAQLLTGENIQLSNYRGKVVMLNFWATWCPPCRAEMPAIQEAYDMYQERGFIVLAINNAETPSQIQDFVDAFSLDMPMVLDVDGRLQRSFGIRSYPTSIFINKEGFIYATHTGMLTPLQLIDYIESGLDQ